MGCLENVPDHPPLPELLRLPRLLALLLRQRDSGLPLSWLLLLLALLRLLPLPALLSQQGWDSGLPLSWLASASEPTGLLMPRQPGVRALTPAWHLAAWS